MKIKSGLCYLSGLIILAGCAGNKQVADELFYNGHVYTVDAAFSTETAFAVADGKIIATGPDDEILEHFSGKQTNLNGKYVYPGLHDGHCHFYGYGTDMNKIWLGGTTSFSAILDTVVTHRNQKIGDWIFGRGWDQNDWDTKTYPDNTKLDSLFPDTPVILLRIDGHAALVNSVALKLSGITPTSNINGGLIEKRDGKLTGLLIDAAVDLVYAIVPKFTNKEQVDALINAQKDCFAVGLTSVTDAGIENGGLSKDVILLIDSLQQSGDLQMRINAMALIDDYDYYKKNGKIHKPFLNVQSFKIYSDGSLGSRGACLLEQYDDQPGHYGFMVHTATYLDSVAGLINDLDFQMCTHCIGDSSHRTMLRIYEKYLTGKKDQRWRIEHAQVIHPDDYQYYKNNNILPSVQPTHATSDMYWAEERIGPERIKHAYAYAELLKQNNILISGSDFPVESINPFLGLYAAISRKDLGNFPENGFQYPNRLNREEAIRSFTIWPAYGSFTENEKGSLEWGKYADFIILDQDLMTIPEREIADIKVFATYVNGEKVYQRGE